MATMYNTVMSGYSKNGYEQQSFERRQKIMAQYHRDQMRLRELKKRTYTKNTQSKIGLFLENFIILILRSTIRFIFFVKNILVFLFLKIRFFLKASFIFLKHFLINTKYFFSNLSVKLKDIADEEISREKLIQKISSDDYSFPKEGIFLREEKNSTNKYQNIIPSIKKIISFMQHTIHQQAQGIKRVSHKIYQKQKKEKSLFKRILFVFLLLFVLGVVLLGIWFSTLEIPSVENFENRKISTSTKIYDKTGEIVLYDIHDNIRRTVVGFDDIAQPAKDSIVAIEDHSFYNHGGVVWKSTIRAVLQTILSQVGINIFGDGTAGGSTLTQQVIKNTILNRDRVISRKVKEWVLAYKIEGKLTKDQILEIYLNEAPYGGTIYGIQEASRQFFGVEAKDLTVAQSAYLAAIPNLPTFYSPYGPNFDKLKKRQRTVLAEMKRYGFITDEVYKSALEEAVVFLPEDQNKSKSLHFVQFIREELEARYGADMVENGGLQVITSLDYELQQKAEEIIKNHIAEVESVYDASNAGLVAIDAKTGQIITMVGSRDYSDTEGFDGNFNVALAKRQPGSSFKPIAYVTAFEKGYYPETAVFDVATQFNTGCAPDNFTSEDGCYSPKNYDDKFKGPMALRNALAESRNIPAIKINYLAGLSNVIKKAKDLGITSLNQSATFYGLGLVLGGGEVSLLEMTNVYATFANDGVYNKTTGILEVRDIQGNTLEKFTPKETRVIESNAVRMLNSVLSDNAARSPLFGANSFLSFGDRRVAGKTGTTNDNRDAWLIGYTPDVAVGVWTGNNDNSPMKKGSSISGKPWRQYMDVVLQKYPQSSFPEYTKGENFASLPAMVRGVWQGGTTVYIDTTTGKLATEFTPEESKLAVPQPDPHTILHYINKDNPTVPDGSKSDSQYKNWEFGVRRYVETYLADIINFKVDIPTETDDIHLENGDVGAVEFTIQDLKEKTYGLDELVNIKLDNISSSEEDRITKVQLFINNAFVSSKESGPYEFDIIPRELKYFEEKNIIRIIITDDAGLRGTAEATFNLEL
jgi:membrane peptidoglycan carboxypeptidase